MNIKLTIYDEMRGSMIILQAVHEKRILTEFSPTGIDATYIELRERQIDKFYMKR